MILKKILNNIKSKPSKNAFCINNIFYSYADLGVRIRTIQDLITNRVHKTANIGVIANNDIDTYASILAVLFSGCCFVPINPRTPFTRNKGIIKSAGIDLILSSDQSAVVTFASLNIDVIVAATLLLKNNLADCIPNIYSRNTEYAYILFTSGSTGIPKGVQISCSNLNSFIDAFFNYFDLINDDDKFLQMYELTFDASVMHYFPALYIGACTYTISDEGVKYFSAYEVLNEYKITFALLMPSALSYLRRYFDAINLPDLKYSLFGGEAVSHSLVLEWSKCVPNARIFNAYGPTEATVFFMIFDWTLYKEKCTTYNDLIPIGKPWKNTSVILIDEEDQIILNGTGQICVSGPQVTYGYINDEYSNHHSFLQIYQGNNLTRFYKTGDMAFIDDNNDFIFIGRTDEQVQIDGHRIELGEIEKHAKKCSSSHNCIGIAFLNEIGIRQIALFIENPSIDNSLIIKELRKYLPYYMVPEIIVRVDKFPLNINGKYDKNALLNLIKK